jgi:hypothetical protein
MIFLRHVRYGTRLVGIYRCECGLEIHCAGFTNTCACGRDYNWNGSRLAPRDQWGEDTGESLSDILTIP